MAKKKLTIEDMLVHKEEIPYELPENWCWVTFESVIDNVSSSKKKIKQKEYLEEGRFPIIDQGANMIGGYTNDEELLYDVELPVIIFGDHTRCVKYIDFKFAQGADGVKVLKVKQGLNPMYIYYLMLNLELPNKGYSRHYKFLRDSKLQIPPLAEQERIVNRIESLFEKVDKASELVEEAREGFDKRRASILEKAFSGELTKSWRKENNVDFSWKSKKLNEIIMSIQAGKNFKCTERPANTNEVGLIKISAVTWGIFNPLENKIVEDKTKINEAYFIKEGDFLISRANTLELVGSSVIVDSVNQDLMLSDKVWRVLFDECIVNKRLINYYLKSMEGRKQIESRATGNQLSMRNISQNSFKDISIILPEIDEQNEIVRILDKIFKEEMEIKELTDLPSNIDVMKKSILAKAFRGELGSNNLEEESSIELLLNLLG